jgi:hypothetical protein
LKSMPKFATDEELLSYSTNVNHGYARGLDLGLDLNVDHHTYATALFFWYPSLMPKTVARIHKDLEGTADRSSGATKTFWRCAILPIAFPNHNQPTVILLYELRAQRC